MNEDQINAGRRGVLKLGSIAVVTIAMGSQAAHSLAQDKKGGGGNRVDEKDPTAQSLGYKHDATKVDKAKFASYQPGQTCANCQQFQGKATEAWAPCTIFAGKEVANKGWCSAWVKKT
ncbi:MAG: putative high potential iron-sulfur protein [Betaproteobacteria bacterium]|nr:putative high potential iron-sulfur protein [Betaproteobacteria bacterium]